MCVEAQSCAVMFRLPCNFGIQYEYMFNYHHYSEVSKLTFGSETLIHQDHIHEPPCMARNKNPPVMILFNSCFIAAVASSAFTAEHIISIRPPREPEIRRKSIDNGAIECCSTYAEHDPH